MVNYRFLLCCVGAWLLQAALARGQALASGDIYKLAVPASGIFKLDRNTLAQMGIDWRNINPRQLQLFGQGGGMLPQVNNAPRPNGLAEVAIWVQGEDDGRFDTDDFVLFYAEGPDRSYYDPAARLFGQEKNLYDDANYYFLVVGRANGKRIQPQPDAGPAANVVDVFDDFVHYEKDEFNLLRSGRQWLGERFDFQTDYTIRLDVPGIAAGSNASITSAVMAQSTINTSFNLQLNGQALGTQQLPALPAFVYARKGVTAENTFTLALAAPPANDQLQIRVRYDKQGVSSGFGHLDFLTANVRRQLRLYGEQTRFRSTRSLAAQALEYQIANATADMAIWDVSQPSEARQQAHRLAGNVARFGTSSGGTPNAPREYVAFKGNHFPAPRFVEKTAPQNLRNLPAPDLLIISHEAFLAQARRLAEFRRNHDQLSVEVVSTKQVYNEFASGRQDVSALRDFVRHLYLGGNRKLKYVLLLGDASVDYKDRLPNNTNYVPTYQSRESLHPIFSFSSDDYFGMLDAQEGEWSEDLDPTDDLEVGIGRLPAKSVAEATALIDKLLRYQAASAQGPWRQQVSFVADDGDFHTHLIDSEKLSEKIKNTVPLFDIDKIYVDAFAQELTPNGKKSPAARDALNRRINEGALILNYTGHGSETGWASEGILDNAQVSKWNNLDRLPLFVTATCEFGRFDNPDLTSGAEYAVLSPRGGAIAMLTTTRPVFSSTNYILNDAFYDAVFRPIGGQMPRLGDVLRLTKNRSINGVLNRNFSLLGDPSMRLAYPQLSATITSLQANGSPTDTLRALASISLSGEVRQGNTLQANFNGTVRAIVYDKTGTAKTLGDEDGPADYQQREAVLFRGDASVRNGRFEIKFVVPKNIDYAFGKGRIALYAQDPAQNLDAAGFSNSIVVGGTQPNFTPDNQPPTVRLWMDNEQFADGGKVAPNTALIALLTDDSGLNITGAGIGQDIQATLDGQQTFVLNSLFVAERDNFKQGRITLPLQGLPEGPHTIRLKAWDTHNNSTETKINFVVEKEPLAVNELLAFPNPTQGPWQVRFKHNKQGEDLEAVLDIYTLTGQLLRSIDKYLYNSRNEYETIAWDGLGSGGQKPSPGVYLFRLTVKQLSMPYASSSWHGKIIMLNE